MSRTYRKVNPTRNQVFAVEEGRFVWREPTKAERAKWHSDGGPWRHNAGWYHNQVSRKGRRVNRKQFHKLYTYAGDPEYFDFDDSEYVKKRKGIWWDIC